MQGLSLIGRRCGIVREIHAAPRDLDDPEIHAYGGMLCDTSAFANARAVPTCGGGGATADEALACCLGEAAERYAAALWGVEEIVRDTARGLGDRAYPVEELSLFTESQYRKIPFSRPTRDTLLPWTRMTRLSDGRETWVPAAFVYLPPPPGIEIAPSLSTGLACHGDLRTAIRRALCECVERDALAIMWLGRVVCPRIDAPFIVGDMTTDLGIPAFYCLMEGESAMGPVVSFGAACDPDPAEAVRRAVLEAGLGRIYVKELRRREPEWKEEVCVDFAAHARYYTMHPERRGALEFLKSGRTVPLRGPGRLELDGYVKEITPPDIAETGLRVVRVWVPELVPLHGDDRFPFLGSPRLARFGRRINPWPHPMP
jgi:ribosomal protein S12 methylthiotransferase accessory factor